MKKREKPAFDTAWLNENLLFLSGGCFVGVKTPEEQDLKGS